AHPDSALEIRECFGNSRRARSRSTARRLQRPLRSGDRGQSDPPDQPEFCSCPGIHRRERTETGDDKSPRWVRAAETSTTSFAAGRRNPLSSSLSSFFRIAREHLESCRVEAGNRETFPQVTAPGVSPC